MSRTFLILFLMVLLVGVASPGLATNTPTLELETAVHFLTPGGEDVRLEAGIYEVEATDTGLKLLPEGGARTDVILLEAIVGEHEEILDTPAVRYGPAEDQEDVIHLALLLPDGTGHEAVGSYSGIRPRGYSSVLAFLQSKMRYRQPQTKRRPRQQRRQQSSLSTSKSKSQNLALPPNPVDCGPFLKTMKSSTAHRNPALAVYRGKMHLVTQYLPKTSSSLMWTLQHAIYANGKWGKFTRIKDRRSRAGVALATFGNRLHMVHLGRKSKNLYHATYDGRKWSKSTKITAQKSKATPTLWVHKNRLYLVHRDHKSDDLWYALYSSRGGWTARQKIRISRSDKFVQSNGSIGMFRSFKFRLFLPYVGKNKAIIYQMDRKENGQLRSAYSVSLPVYEPNIKIKSIATLSLSHTKQKSTFGNDSEFVMFLDDSRKLRWTHNPTYKKKLKPFLHEKSKSRPALAQPQRCVHAVYVHHPSGKLRHVQFDVESLQ